MMPYNFYKKFFMGWCISIVAHILSYTLYRCGKLFIALSKEQWKDGGVKVTASDKIKDNIDVADIFLSVRLLVPDAFSIVAFLAKPFFPAYLIVILSISFCYARTSAIIWGKTILIYTISISSLFFVIMHLYTMRIR
jgi:hypothetical protein